MFRMTRFFLIMIFWDYFYAMVAVLCLIKFQCFQIGFVKEYKVLLRQIFYGYTYLQLSGVIFDSLLDHNLYHFLLKLVTKNVISTVNLFCENLPLCSNFLCLAQGGIHRIYFMFNQITCSFFNVNQRQVSRSLWRPHSEQKTNLIISKPQFGLGVGGQFFSTSFIDFDFLEGQLFPSRQKVRLTIGNIQLCFRHKFSQASDSRDDS